MDIHLIDGTYELFRAYFGAPKRQTSDGLEVGATVGLLSSLLALLREDGVSHLAVAFDTVIESFRNQMFAGYKTGEGVPEDLLAQFPLAERAAQVLGLVVWPMVEFEADDALATAAARWAEVPGVERVLLCSPDKDLTQCVRDGRVVCLDRRRRKVLDREGVIAKFGVPPESIPDYLALVGDSADGIPGLRGWGARSAATLLAEYGHLEQIPDDAEQWQVKVRGAAGLAETLSSQRPQAELYRTLATLRTDVPLSESLDDLAWGGVHRGPLEALCIELETTEPLSRVPRWHR